MNRIKTISLVLTILLASVAHSSLQAQWSLVSPYPGWINDIKAFGGGYVCATFQGMYRSMDNGQTWAYFLPQGVAPEAVLEMEVSGTSVLLQTLSNRLFFSSDNGFTFQEIETASLPKPLQVYEICLYNEYVYLVTPIVLYRSSNLGAQWQTVSGQVRNLKKAGAKLYEATLYKLRVSTNQGFSWTELFTSSLTIPDYYVSGDTILLIEDNQTHIQRSVNGGQTWQQSSLPISYNTNFNLFARHNQRLLLDIGNRVIGSDNLGASWVSNSKHQDETTTRCLFADNQIILRGSDYGLHRSVDGGATFQAASTGLVAGFSNTLRSINGHLYAASRKGMYVLSDDGDSWKNWKLSDLDSLFPYNDLIYANGRFVAGHIYSDDNGQTWLSNTSLHDRRRFAMVNGWMVSYGFGECYYSSNTGESWEDASDGFILNGGGDYAMSFNTIEDTLWGIGAAKRLMHSENGGLSWNPQGDSLSFHMYDYPWFTHIASIDGRLVLEAFSDSTGHNLWVSDDNGINWTPKTPPSETGLIEHSIYQNGTWIAACSPGGVFLSKDKGDTWTAFNDGLRTEDASFIAIHNGEIWMTGAPGTCKRPLQDILLSTLGLEGPDALRIMPNPTMGAVQVESRETKGLLQIFDCLGKCVYSNPGFMDSETIDTQLFQAGVYRVVLNNGIRVFVQNLVVTK